MDREEEKRLLFTSRLISAYVDVISLLHGGTATQFFIGTLFSSLLYAFLQLPFRFGICLVSLATISLWG